MHLNKRDAVDIPAFFLCINHDFEDELLKLMTVLLKMMMQNRY